MASPFPWQWLLPMSAGATGPQGRRFVVPDARCLQAPGAHGTASRLHLSMDLVSFPWVEVCVSAVPPGETRPPCALAPGEGAVTDRGEAPAQGRRDAGTRGAVLLVRLHPLPVVVCDATGQSLTPEGTGMTVLPSDRQVHGADCGRAPRFAAPPHANCSTAPRVPVPAGPYGGAGQGRRARD